LLSYRFWSHKPLTFTGVDPNFRQIYSSSSENLQTKRRIKPANPKARTAKENIMKKNDFTVMHPVPEHIISRNKGFTILSQLTVRIE